MNPDFAQLGTVVGGVVVMLLTSLAVIRQGLARWGEQQAEERKKREAAEAEERKKREAAEAEERQRRLAADRRTLRRAIRGELRSSGFLHGLNEQLKQLFTRLERLESAVENRLKGQPPSKPGRTKRPRP